MAFLDPRPIARPSVGVDANCGSANLRCRPPLPHHLDESPDCEEKQGGYAFAAAFRTGRDALPEAVRSTPPKDIAERLHVEAGDELFVVETDEGVLLTPYDPEFQKAMAA